MESDRIRKLVEEALDLHAESGEEALEAWLARHPEDESAVRARLRVLLESGLFTADGELPIDTEFGDFSILEELGRGGMGVVYRAHQISLDRDVALKVLRPEQALIGKARRRFQKEVETVARLHHDGIVPVHAVGCQEGLSWFAMEWVRGTTVAQALGALADRGPQAVSGRDLAQVVADAAQGGPQVVSDGASLFQGSWEQVCLRITRQVALALDHAHRHGVLHRDVKPSNIMLTPQGRVQLLDFGVSASLESTDTERMTRTGAFLGTLGYMSPEQVRGDFDALDARTDVFSLGITLHEMLALEPAFQGTPRTILSQVSEGRRSSVRDRLPSISWEAETILMAATDPDVNRRYPTAGHMARDLEAALQHRPILARRPPRIVRWRRWSQRHPARAATLVMGVLALLVGPVSYGVIQRAHRIELQSALEESESQRRRAESNLDASRETLRLVTGIVEKMDVPSLKTERSIVLQRILNFYERYLDQRSDDVAMRLEGAVARLAAGGIRGALGDRVAMRKQQLAAIAELRALVEERPKDSRARLELVVALRNHCWQLFLDGDAQRALPLTREALVLSEGWDSSGAPRKWELARAKLLFVAGNVERVTGDRESAMRSFSRAIDVERSWLSKGPDDQLSDDLALALIERAWLIADGGATDRALVDVGETVKVLENLAARNPNREDHRSSLVNALTDQGLLFARLKDWKSAQKCHERAIALSRQLMLESPLSPSHGLNLAGSLQNLSSVLQKAGHGEEAITLLLEGKDLLDAMHRRDPDNRTVRFRLAATLGRLGNLALSEGDLDAARERFAEGSSHMDAILAVNPQQPSWLRRRVQLARLLASVLDRQGDYRGLAEVARSLLASGEHDKSIHLWCARVASDAMMRAGRDGSSSADERDRIMGNCKTLALRALETSPVTEPADLEKIEGARGLEPVRDDPRYPEVITRLRARIAGGPGKH